MQSQCQRLFTAAEKKKTLSGNYVLFISNPMELDDLSLQMNVQKHHIITVSLNSSLQILINEDHYSREGNIKFKPN